MIFDFLKRKNECRHTRVPIDVDEAYCPDCGALIRNKWYLVRCACCDIKRSAHSHYNDIVPDTKFCHNCGSTEYYIEEIEKLNFIDVHYAVFKQEIVEQQGCTTRQVWVEKEENLLTERKLLESGKS